MVRRSRSVSYLVPLEAAGVLPVQILPENPNRELYSVQNMDAANSVHVSPNQNVTAAAGSYQGQEVVARGYVSDDMDQGCVYAIAVAAGAVRIVVQETSSYQDSRPAANSESREAGRTGGRTPFRRESRMM